MYDTRVNNKEFWRKYRESKQGRWYTVLPLQLRKSEGSTVKTVIIFCGIHTGSKANTDSLWSTSQHNGYTYLHNLITAQIDTDFTVQQCGGAVRLPSTHLSTRHGAKGVGWPHHGLRVHHSGRIHHPHRAHLWRLWCVCTEKRDILLVMVFFTYVLYTCQKMCGYFDF